MTWFGWVFVTLTIIGTPVTIRKAKSNGEAAGVALANAFLIWGAVVVGTT